MNTSETFKEISARVQEESDIGLRWNSPDYTNKVTPTKLIGTPFMGYSTEQQRELFFISKAYIEKLYGDWITVKNNCDVRMKFSPCKDCGGRLLHIVAQGFREHAEQTISNDWKALSKKAADLLALDPLVETAIATIAVQSKEKSKCKNCVFQSYSKLLKKLFNDFQLTLEES